ncbi:MAG: glycosyltransferase family 61 protein [Chthoniobacter sp.]|nr:glycosyltransferase family 61 protein [Chthoniobacter sp.]
MTAISSIAHRLESVARPVIRTARHSWPGALRALGLPVGVHETIDDWAGETLKRGADEKLMSLREEPCTSVAAVSPRHLPEQSHPGFSEDLVYTDVRTFVAKMRDARVTGRNGYVVDSTGRILGDVPKVYRAHYTPAAHPLLGLVRPPAVTLLPGRSAALAIFSTGNYYHWMFEALPRLELLRQAGVDLGTIDWFIVNDTANQFVQPSLAALGIPEAKLRVTRDGLAWRCEELLVPSMPCQTNPSRWVCEYLRQHFWPSVPHAPKCERLFVSRAPGAKRRVTNESEVEALLVLRGFRKIYLESCSLAEQVALFANAEAIVAAHGASMANLVFCAPRTKVIEIFDPEYVNPCYWGVAQQVDLDYGYLLGEGEFTGVVQNMARVGDDIRVSLPRLESLLSLFEL